MDGLKRAGEQGEVNCVQVSLRNPCTNMEPLSKEECQSLLIQDGTALSEIQHAQMELVLREMAAMDEGLPKYVHLMNLYEQNETLFYFIITNRVELTLPIIYTPVVGLACQNFGALFNNPRGLYIRLGEKGNIINVLKTWPHKDIKAICVTDGERILGLGDLGAHGMGIPIGKLMLYTAIGRIPPQNCLPVTLDVGTNNESLLEDPNYRGIKKKRITGLKYEQFMDEFMTSVTSLYGDKTLVQFEDFGNHNAFAFMARYADKYCSFNDDIQGTAAVTLSGLITACQRCELRLVDCTFLLQGAGEAALGIANLLFKAMKLDGLPEDTALQKIFMVDSKGLVVKNRSTGGISEHKARFAQEYEEILTLEDAVTKIRPTAIIGVAAVAGAFTTTILEKMASFNKKPIIFALSNPTRKAECTAAEAYKATKGKCIFASGSPFGDVLFKKKPYRPSQCNNAYIFPAIALATVACNIQPITEGLFLFAAKALSKQITLEEIKLGLLFPSLNRIQDVTFNIATALIKYAYKYKIARLMPEPAVKEKTLAQLLYSPEYKCMLKINRERE